jgi:hypothetical protein
MNSKGFFLVNLDPWLIPVGLGTARSERDLPVYSCVSLAKRHRVRVDV